LRGEVGKAHATDVDATQYAHSPEPPKCTHAHHLTLYEDLSV
jgi:hypothetical protein